MSKATTKVLASARDDLEAPCPKTIVEVRNLRKVFPKRAGGGRRWPFRRRAPEGAFVAVEGVSFNIYEGEIFGLLGPNGAGKTTTIRMLSTLLEPTSGSARVNGYDVTHQAQGVRGSLGAVLTGERSVYWKLTGRENLEYFAALYHLPPKVAKARVAELLERLNLSERADETVERYSSGMKQRVAIAKALLADPPVLLLDEPTVGLDPQSARNLRELILEIKREGRTVLLTTHYMEEADLLSDRIGIVDAGRIIALDTPRELKKLIKQLDILALEVENADPALAEDLETLPGVQQVVVGAHREGATSFSIHTSDGRGALGDVLGLVNAHAGRVRHLHIAQPTLEDVFITLTGKGLRD